MAKKVLVLIISNAGLGLRFARRAKEFMKDVKVALWAEGEDHVASGWVDDRLKEVIDSGIEVVACRKQAEGRGYEKALRRKKVKLVSVSEYVSKAILEGREVLTF